MPPMDTVNEMPSATDVYDMTAGEGEVENDGMLPTKRGNRIADNKLPGKHALKKLDDTKFKSHEVGFQQIGIEGIIYFRMKK